MVLCSQPSDTLFIHRNEICLYCHPFWWDTNERHLQNQKLMNIKLTPNTNKHTFHDHELKNGICFWWCLRESGYTLFGQCGVTSIINIVVLSHRTLVEFKHGDLIWFHSCCPSRVNIYHRHTHTHISSRNSLTNDPS